MLTRPPCPPLFPYTTLFRSRVRAADTIGCCRASSRNSASPLYQLAPPQPRRAVAFRRRGHFAVQSSYPLYPRSEEHTSELQSLRHLVCRLLLEKKNNNICTD